MAGTKIIQDICIKEFRLEKALNSRNKLTIYPKTLERGFRELGQIAINAEGIEEIMAQWKQKY